MVSHSRVAGNPRRTVLALGIEMAEALNAAHSKGVIHRDMAWRLARHPSF
jgi:hypothetical protein